MPKPTHRRAELEALVRVSRANLVEQINDTKVDAEAIVTKLEAFVVALVGQHVDELH